MTITIKAWTDNLGAQIGVRLYLQSAPDDQVGSDLMLDRYDILGDLSAYYEVIGVSIGVGDYHAHIYEVSVVNTINEDNELPTATLSVSTDGETVWIGGDSGASGAGGAVQQTITVSVSNMDGVSGLPETIRVGDAYGTGNGAAWHVSVTNAAGTVLTGLGAQSFSNDAVLRFADLSTGLTVFSGAVTWDAGSEVFVLQIIDTETDKAVAGTRYRAQLILWPDSVNERTIADWCIKATRKAT